jgi:alanyl-tRNA synthetase
MGKELAAAADTLKQKLGDSGICVLAGSDGEKVALVITVGKALVQKGIKAGDLVKVLAAIVGGSGGGKPEMAQAGGKEPGKLAELLAAVPAALGKYNV